jgi:DHA3 family tetracycline resistance protein-like MFS transporter
VTRPDAAAARARPSAYAVYLILSGMTTLANTVNFTVLAIYYVTIIHMDPLQLVLVGTVLEGTILLFEIPTGILADTFSRRLSVIVGTALLGVGCLVTGAVPLFAAILVAETIRGIGETFVDGAREAWIAGEVGEERIAHVFTRAAQVRQVVAFGAIIVSVALASIDLRLPVLAAGVLHLGLSGFLIVAMPERAFARTPQSERASWRSSLAEMTGTLRAGTSLVRRTPLLLAFLALALIFGAASEGFDRLWEAHILIDFTFPAVGHLKPVVWFGVIQLALTPLEIAGLELVRRRVDVRRQRGAAWTLLALTALQLAGVAAFALAGGFFLAIVAFGLADVMRTLSRPIRDAWLTTSVNPRVRATVLSLMGQSDALGQVAGGPGIGAIGKELSLRAAIACSGLLLAPALPLYAWTARAGSRRPGAAPLDVAAARSTEGESVIEEVPS